MQLALNLVWLWIDAQPWPGAPTEETERAVTRPEIGLKMTLPEIEELEEFDDDSSEQRLGQWHGKLGDKEVVIELYALAQVQFHFEEPEDITDLIAWNYRENGRKGGQPGFMFTDLELIDGSFGFLPYAVIARARRQESGSTRDLSSLFVFAAVLEQHGCYVEVECSPPASDDEAALLISFLELEVAFEGKSRNAAWEDKEATARWEEHAPESARGDEFKLPIRTRHYIILTNSSGGSSFAKKMEENYLKIQKMYPFEEVAGRKLMPVFLFRTNAEYYAFCISRGWTEAQAKASKGHASGDFYATWYESPNDPTHIHEATHQIFRNRLRLDGGGSWFQEGVAEYICTQQNERNAVAGLIAKGRHTPLRELLGLKSLLHSSGTDQRTGDKAGTHYFEAALLVEFLKESKWGKGKFEEFCHQVGKAPRQQIEVIERIVRKVYDVSLEELDEKLSAYCKSR